MTWTLSSLMSSAYGSSFLPLTFAPLSCAVPDAAWSGSLTGCSRKPSQYSKDHATGRELQQDTRQPCCPYWLVKECVLEGIICHHHMPSSHAHLDSSVEQLQPLR